MATGGVDAHTHLDHPAFDADRERVCQRSIAAGVTGWVIAGANPKHWDRVVATARSCGALAVLGIHPWWTNDTPEDLERALAELPHRLTRHGMGEIGLDRMRAKDPTQWDRQQAFLKAQLDLAVQLDTPVVFHCVRAWDALRGHIDRSGLPSSGGMVHGWMGSKEQAKEVVARGLHVSFGPPTLRSPKSLEAAHHVPLDRLLLESDCPDRPLAGHDRGEPSHLVPLATRLAESRGMTTDAMLQATGDNLRQLLRYDQPSEVGPKRSSSSDSSR
jgi:TatD DNase family protein